MTDYTELKRLAEAATPGRNFDRLPMAGGGLKYECTGDDGSLVLKVDHKNDEWGFVGDNGQADEEFFLACTPAAVLALIAENERLSGECEGCPMQVAEELRAENAGLQTGYKAYEQVNAELRAEVEALKAERNSKILCDLDLFENLRDAASTEAGDHRQCMAAYRPQRQAYLDSVVQKCDDLLAAMGRGEQP